MRSTKLMRRTFRVRCSSGHSCMEQERSNAPGRCIAPKLVLWLGMALILAFLLTVPLSVSAQGDADTIERLEVRLWPDFDRPSVLTTLVGFLPPGTPDPFSLTLPVPVDASIHAVSPLREDGSPGPEMAYDDSVPGQLTFSTSSTGFWLEYYSPYTADGNSRNLTFVWQSEIAIDELEAVVQQPMMSSDLTTDPDADSVTTGPQGMQYHQIRGRQVPAGSIYSLDANYTMVQPQLSQDALGQQSAAVGGSVEDESGFNWLLVMAIAAGLVAVVAVGWILLSGRSSKRRVAKPRPVRNRPPRARAAKRGKTPSSSQKAGQFCHECGQPVSLDDRFCRSCGTAVKKSV